MLPYRFLNSLLHCNAYFAFKNLKVDAGLYRPVEPRFA